MTWALEDGGTEERRWGVDVAGSLVRALVVTHALVPFRQPT